jgi:hypothetical protein
VVGQIGGECPQRTADIPAGRFAGDPARRLPAWFQRQFRVQHWADWKVGGTADWKVCATGLEPHAA